MTASNDMAPEAILAAHAAEAARSPLPPSVETRVRCHLLDTLAAILSGRFLPAGEFGHRFAAARADGGTATILGSGRRAPPEWAAFANAMSAHADETDDSHIRGRFHPGCGVVPAALAMAEHRGSTGDQLLRAIALGYDVGARATMALGFSNPRTTTFSTHSFGALFGAAAAAGALIGLDRDRIGALLSFTVQQASGLSYWNRDPDHVEKSFDFGAKAARNGIFAAQLAEAGMTAPDLPLTGANGFLEAFAENPRPEALTDGLGTRFEIERATIKKWPVGSPMQSVLDAVEAIFGGEAEPPDSISEITVRVPSNRFHVIDDARMPAVCAQHLVALAVSRGPVGFADSHDHGLMLDATILALRRKVNLVPDDALAETEPERQSIVEVRMLDGSERSHHAKVVRGTPDSPMEPGEVAEKARDILAPILPDGGAALIEHCLGRGISPSGLAVACSGDPFSQPNRS